MTMHDDSGSPFGSSRPLTRRTLVGLCGAVGLAVLAGCTAAASASSSVSAAASSTQLGPGTYTATFGSSSDSSGQTGGAQPTGAGTPPSGGGGTPPAGGTPPSGQPGGQATGQPGGGSTPGGSGGSAPGGTGGGSSNTQKLSGAYLVNGIKATVDGGTWASTTADQNVFLVVNGGSLTITNATITKTGDSSQEEACNFYGLNSAILVVDDGSSATIKNCTVTTDAEGANAVFAASSGAITIETISIKTSKNSSRGLDATYAGTVTAKDVTIATTGAHCACLATDRGNGTIKVTGTNKLNAAGDGSPLVYSTGDISVTGATGTATGAQTMVIEGKNQIEVTDCTFTTSGTTGMMIYQSFSGDAADSDATATKSSMTITNSTITSSTDKPMIYVTNTSCQVSITASKLEHSGTTQLLSLAEDRWGTSGSNGGHAEITVSNSTLTGAMEAGATSSATVALKDGSKLTGATSGSVTVTKDATSTWTS